MTATKFTTWEFNRRMDPAGRASIDDPALKADSDERIYAPTEHDGALWTTAMRQPNALEVLSDPHASDKELEFQRMRITLRPPLLND